MTMTQEGAASVDLIDPLVYERGIPHERFAHLRATDPVHWHPESPPNHGFWAVTRYADIQRVSRDTATFSSAAGFVGIEELAPDAMEMRRSMIETDPPEHTRLRRLVGPLFTPRAIEGYRDHARSIASRLLDAAIERDEFDWARDVCEPMPIRVFVDIMGIEQEEADVLARMANQLVTGDDPELAPPAAAFERARARGYEPRMLPFRSPAALDLFDYGRRLGEERRREPKDDLLTRLVQAEWDGDRLTESEFLNFFQLLIFAGNETTRTSLQQGMLAFIQHPGQLELLRGRPELIPRAVEEVLRWATPIYYFRRTAMVATEIGEREIQPGDKVVMWYISGNFDEEAFEDPYRFDVTREGPAHLTFGGGGPHFCLGAFLARMQVGVMLEEFLRRGVRLELTRPVARLRSNFTNGIKRMPVRAVGA